MGSEMCIRDRYESLLAIDSEDARRAFARLSELEHLADPVCEAVTSLAGMVHLQLQMHDIRNSLEILKVTSDPDKRRDALHELSTCLSPTGSFHRRVNLFAGEDNITITSNAREAWKELSLKAWLVEDEIREHLVTCAAILGSYEALSHAWSTSERTRSIMISQQGMVPITASLHDALQELRFCDRRRRLWVNAICIDQSNADERTAQVIMMSSIYATAFRVIPWLGTSDGSEVEALALARALGVH